MKKIFAVLCASTLLLSACGSGSAEDSGKVKFKVGMECGYAPFNWQTSSTSDTSVALASGAGNCDGYDVMVAKKIADKLGMELEVQKIAWEGLQPAIDSGTIDAVIAGMTADADREKGYDFTTPYYESEMVMIVRKDDTVAGYTDIQQFTGKTIVGQLSTNYDTVIDQIKGVKHSTAKKTYPEMVLALQSKEVDGITAELPVAQGVIGANSDLAIVRFEAGKGFQIDTSVSIAMKEGTRDTEAFKNVQSALDSITEDERNEMMKAAIDNQPSNE